MTAGLPRALLVSLRDPNDPMAAQERACFAATARLPVENVALHPMVHGQLTADQIRSVDAVFFGGSGAYSVLDDVDWIRAGMEALLRVIDARVPAWASCFGFQGLAVALGGRVERDDSRTELGAALLTLTDAGRADPLLGTLPARFWAQEGHHDHVTVLPPGVTRLVTGDVSPEQAFKVDGAPFWASQFHPELTVATTIDRFLHYFELYHEGDRADGEATLARIRASEETEGVTELLARLVRHEL